MKETKSCERKKKTSKTDGTFSQANQDKKREGTNY